MRIAVIIAEYNPFHNGHAYHIAQTRKNGATHIAVVMSGNFVQRGEPAFLEKHVRARAALSGGADLVLELDVYKRQTPNRSASRSRSRIRLSRLSGSGGHSSTSSTT